MEIGKSRRWIASASLVASGLIAGGILAGSHIAGAQIPTQTAQAPTAGAPRDESKAMHPGEALLTGTTADKVRAAALKAVPDGTILRVETDAEGSPYEAHMRKADGTMVTVKVDNNFNATSTEAGHGTR